MNANSIESAPKKGHKPGEDHQWFTTPISEKSGQSQTRRDLDMRRKLLQKRRDTLVGIHVVIVASATHPNLVDRRGKITEISPEMVCTIKLENGKKVDSTEVFWRKDGVTYEEPKRSTEEIIKSVSRETNKPGTFNRKTDREVMG